MEKSELEKIIAAIDGAKKIGLITHREGDGDAFGSMLGLAEVLKTFGKEVVIFSNEELPAMFDFVKSETEYNPVSEFEVIDLLITLDANGCDRFTIPEILTLARENKTPIISLDHHQPGDLAEFSDLYVDYPEKSSTSELVLDLATGLSLKLNRKAASLLLFGLETDTKSFQNTNTTPESFKAAGELLKSGARLKEVSEAATSNRSIPSLKLLGLAIGNLKLDEQTGVGISKLSLGELKKLELEGESTTGIANFLDQLKEVRVIVVLEEREGGMVRGSMRSNNSDLEVDVIAGKFGGGGHKKAAGFLTEGKVDDIAEEILKFFSK